jgi:predicted dehydrogenase
MTEVRWGILGTGQIAADFAQGLTRTHGARLAAVASRTETRAIDFAAQFDDVRPHDSYAALVERDDIDVVYIATPNHRHHEDCHLCLDAGKAILCEKPFTLNRRLAESVIEKARERNLFCMEAMWMRCMPLIQKVKRAVDEGVIGEPQLLVADFGYPVPRDEGNRFYSLDLGGGALLDRGVYVVSLAHLLLGKPRSITGQANMTSTGVDEQAAIVLGFERGAVASLSCSMTHRTRNSAILYGSEGKIEIMTPFYRPHRVALHRGAESVVPGDPIASIPSGWKSRLKTEVKFFLQNTLRYTEPYLPGGLRGRGETWTDIQSGNGYQHEAAEVTACLRRGVTESRWMPLSDTLDVMQTLDELRGAWGIQYSADA